MTARLSSDLWVHADLSDHAVHKAHRVKQVLPVLSSQPNQVPLVLQAHRAPPVRKAHKALPVSLSLVPLAK